MDDKLVRRRFFVSATASLAILLTSIAWAYRIGEKANDAAHALDHRKDELTTLRHMQEAKR